MNRPRHTDEEAPVTANADDIAIIRVRYRENQVLRADDLNAEQRSHLDGRWRHNAVAHGWGIVAGLWLHAEANTVIVRPGMAVDGYGRELIVPKALVIHADVYARLGAAVDVWLRYGRVPQPGQPARWIEQTRLCLKPATEHDPRRPFEVPDEALDRGALASTPDDPVQEWPVYLGRATRTANGVEVSHNGRPYVSVMGETIRAPMDVRVPEDPDNPSLVPPPVPAAQVQLRVLPTRQRFAINVADPQATLVERVAVESSGTTTLRGTARLVNASASRAAPQKRPNASDLIMAEVRIRAESVRDPASIARKLTRGTSELFEYARAQLGGVPAPIFERTSFTEQVGPGDLPAALERIADDPALVALSCGTAPDWHQRPPIATDQAQRARWADLYEARATVAFALNRLLDATELARLAQRAGVPLRNRTWELLRQEPQNRRLLNRLLLEDVFARELVVGSAPLRGAWSIAFGQPKQPPQAAAPWQIYRTEVEQDGVKVHQLRIELGNPGAKGDPTRRKLMIGSTGATGFQPWLTVDAAGTLRVRGRVKVTGELVKSPVPADPSDPRFVDLLVAQWLQGIAAGLGAVESLKLELTGFDTIAAGAGWSYKVKITNTGAEPAATIAVREDATRNDVPIVPKWPGRIETRLDPGQSVEVDVPHAQAVTVGDKLGVIVVAVGFGPNGTPVYGYIARTTQVT